MEEIIDIELAVNLLKEGIVLKDNLNNKFIRKKKRVQVYSLNSSYSLSFEEFFELFKNNKFIIEDFDDSQIDLEKDKEYYSFKHK